MQWSDHGHSSAGYNQDSRRDTFTILRDDGFSGSRVLKDARRLVYVRSFEGRTLNCCKNTRM